MTKNEIDVMFNMMIDHKCSVVDPLDIGCHIENELEKCVPPRFNRIITGHQHVQNKDGTCHLSRS
jgi:hypothetical protein